MQKVITVQRRIVAPMAAVWQVLTNPEALRTGGLGLLRLDGEIRRDGRIRLLCARVPLGREREGNEKHCGAYP